MTIKVRVGGALKEASRIRIRVAGVLRDVVSIRCMIGGELKTVFAGPAPIVTITPDPAQGDSLSASVTTPPMTANVIGGAAPFTYVWTIVSHDGPLPFTNTPNLATTTVTQVGLNPGDEYTATIRVVVTDSLGSTAQAQAIATFSRFGA